MSNGVKNEILYLLEKIKKMNIFIKLDTDNLYRNIKSNNFPLQDVYVRTDNNYPKTFGRLNFVKTYNKLGSSSLNYNYLKNKRNNKGNPTSIKKSRI